MEIERKYLVETPPKNYAACPCRRIEQGYLCTDPVVRVRQDDCDYYLTYKGKGLLSREEYNLHRGGLCSPDCQGRRSCPDKTPL